MVPFLIAGALLGGLEVAFFGGGRYPATAVSLGAGLGAIFGAPFGLVAWIGARALGWIRRKKTARSGEGGVAGPLETSSATGPEGVAIAEERAASGLRPPAEAAASGLLPPAEAARAETLRRHAYVLSVLAVVLLGGVASRFGLFVLFDLQEQDLAKRLSIVFVVVVVGAAFMGAALLSRGISRALAAIDRRVRLPLPLPWWARWLVLVVMPLFLALYPFMRVNGAMLGPLKEGATGVFLIAIGVQTWLLLDGIRARAAKWLSVVTLTVAAAGAIVIGLAAGRMQASLASAQKSPTAQLGGRLSRALTDVDRDGVSSLFGGTDCAPFDARRTPSKVEIPNNGVDEDCDGSDTVPEGKLHKANLFSDALEKDQIRKLNVVWVILETVRADHVSALSYPFPTTPYLSELAQDSLVFTRAYSQSSATVFSVPSMMNGMEPSAAAWKRDHGHPQIADKAPLLAERLKKKGYRTAFVLDTYLQNNFLGVQRGFDEILLAEPDNKKENNRPRRNPISTAKAAEVLARHKPGDQLFMTVYYPDTHSPYTRHKDVDSSSFDASELGDYDTEIAFADQQIRALVEMLKARPAIWDNTILVINADHGEEFGEHGGSRHAQTCYDEVVHVPLLVRIPGVAAKRIDSRVALIDVVPTILEVLGERDGVERLSGQSLFVPALRPDRVDPARPIFCDITSVSSKYGTFLRRAVRDDRYALMQDVTEGKYALFDTVNDPAEREDLSGRAEHAGRMSALRALLDGKMTGNLTDHTKMSSQAPPSPSR